mgnify:CR=1 FL=1
MQISVWGQELSAWVARAQLAAYGNDIINAHSDHEPTESHLRSEPGLMTSLQTAEFNQRLIIDSKQAYLSDVHWIGMASSDFDSAKALVTQLAAATDGPLLIVNQSNFGVGASDELQSLLNEHNHQFVVYFPDVLQAGQAMQQFANPQALLIGSGSSSATDHFLSLLRPFHLGQRAIQTMTRREAEFVKYAMTGLLALRLGYINEMAGLCDQLGLDIDAIRRGMTTDVRIGSHYLQPGSGFGGQQFTQYLEGLSQLLSEQKGSVFVDTLLSQNEVNKEWPFRTLWQHFNCDLKGKTFALWGVAFKPGVADVATSPALRVIDALLAQGAYLQIHDPEALQTLANRYPNHPNISIATQSYEACEGADALLLLTAWPEYASPDFNRIALTMTHPLIIDGRNLYDPGRVHQAGITYYCLGRSCLTQ